MQPFAFLVFYFERNPVGRAGSNVFTVKGFKNPKEVRVGIIVPSKLTWGRVV